MISVYLTSEEGKDFLEKLAAVMREGVISRALMGVLTQ
jgi:hypothetical protein